MAKELLSPAFLRFFDASASCSARDFVGSAFFALVVGGGGGALGPPLPAGPLGGPLGPLGGGLGGPLPAPAAGGGGTTFGNSSMVAKLVKEMPFGATFASFDALASSVLVAWTELLLIFFSIFMFSDSRARTLSFSC